MDCVFEANALCKRYGNISALDALSMRVPEGAIYGFVGRNGAGKTTLLRLLCGLQQPTGGAYGLFGIGSSNSGIAAARRRIGAIVDSPAMYADMTAAENLRQQRRMLGLSPTDASENLLQTVGLFNTGSKKVRHFSRGMRQKLGVAMALVGDPAFVILDEPGNGLDPQGMLALRELILRLNRERGVTFLISSHMLGELARLATHFGFIDHGRMVREMTAGELTKACERSMRVEVSDTRLLQQALARRGIACTVLSDTQADIHARLGLTQLAVELIQDGCEIYTCHEQEVDLEEYFLRLVGGEQNA